jgi:hypothetical protein
VKGLSPGDWWHGRAGKVRFDITMSLGGFIAGSNDGDASVAVWPSHLNAYRCPIPGAARTNPSP